MAGPGVRIGGRVDIYSNLSEKFIREVQKILEPSQQVGIWRHVEVGAARVILKHYQQRGFGHGDRTGRTRRAAVVRRGGVAGRGKRTRIEWAGERGSAPVGILDKWGGKTRNFTPFQFTERAIREAGDRAFKAGVEKGSRALISKIKRDERKLNAIKMKKIGGAV